MSDFDDDRLFTTIEDALKASNKNETLSSSVTIGSKLGDPVEWDSLSFVSVFLAVGKSYGVELDDDDAISFRSVADIKDLLLEILDA